jgi:hypothetical protein
MKNKKEKNYLLLKNLLLAGISFRQIIFFSTLSSLLFARSIRFSGGIRISLKKL